MIFIAKIVSKNKNKKYGMKNAAMSGTGSATLALINGIRKTTAAII